MRQLWIVPTRGRPGNAARLVDAFRTTRGFVDTRLMLCADRDDPALPEYAAMMPPHGMYDWCSFQVDERRGLGGTLNFYAVAAAEQYDAVGFMGDDHLPRTPGWDVVLFNAVKDRSIALAYGDDRFQGENLPTAVLVTSGFIKTLGFMTPPGVQHLFLDNFWLDTGRALNSITYCPAAVIEHMHPQANGKAEWDSGYERVNSGAQWERDQIAYTGYKSVNWPADVSKLWAAQSVVTP